MSEYDLELVGVPIIVAEHLRTLLWIASSTGVVADQFADRIPDNLWPILNAWLEDDEC